MDLNIKDKIEDLVKQIGGDQDLLAKFKADPMGAVQGLLGNINLPTEQLEPLIAGVKAKLNLDQAGGILGKLGGILGGKG